MINQEFFHKHFLHNIEGTSGKEKNKKNMENDLKYTSVK